MENSLSEHIHDCELVVNRRCTFLAARCIKGETEIIKQNCQFSARDVLISE